MGVCHGLDRGEGAGKARPNVSCPKGQLRCSTIHTVPWPAQALEALKVLSGVGEVLSKKMVIFDALAGTSDMARGHAPIAALWVWAGTCWQHVQSVWCCL